MSEDATVVQLSCSLPSVHPNLNKGSWEDEKKEREEKERAWSLRPSVREFDSGRCNRPKKIKLGPCTVLIKFHDRLGRGRWAWGWATDRRSILPQNQPITRSRRAFLG